jgi:hypothetical protein
VERLITNTPIQALVMLNDPTMLEASRVLSGKLMQESRDPETNIYKAFRIIVCRKPTEKEITVLKKYYEGRIATLNESQAADLLDVGEYPQATGLNPVTWASLMQVITAIYNLEETISKT